MSETESENISLSMLSSHTIENSNIQNTVNSSPDFSKQKKEKSINKKQFNESIDLSESLDSIKWINIKKQYKDRLCKRNLLQNLEKSKLVDMILDLQKRCRNMAQFYSEQTKDKTKTIQIQRKKLSKLQNSLNSLQEKQQIIVSSKIQSLESQQIKNSQLINKNQEDYNLISLKQKILSQKKKHSLPVMNEPLKMVNQIISNAIKAHKRNSLGVNYKEDSSLDNYKQKVSKLKEIHLNEQIRQLNEEFLKSQKGFIKKINLNKEDKILDKYGIEIYSTALTLIFIIIDKMKSQNINKKISIPKVLIYLVSSCIQNLWEKQLQIKNSQELTVIKNQLINKI